MIDDFLQATSQSKAIRKLEPNEVVMLLSVPCKDSDIDVMRVSGHLERCLKVGNVLKIGRKWIKLAYSILFFGDSVLVICSVMDFRIFN